MRRADRLFQIIQVLRRTRKPLTADAIAAELETSKRTIYRDIATLIGQRVPIRGEAGMGYILEKGFDLPPLMLTPDEIEAAVLGAQWVAGHADSALARAAEDLMAKIADTVPERLRPFVLEPASRARPSWNREPDRLDMARTRTQIHEGRKIMLRYRDEQGPPQRAHDLADLGRLSRSRAPACGLVRAARRLPQLPHRPRRGCELSRR
ncbi:putative DNA-binding transcriptional regulator YafY [Bradyrhizobium sp. i1.3.1]